MGNDKRERSKVSSGKSLLGRTTSSNEVGFDWAIVEPERLSKIIQLVTGRGGAIRFGYSRDGKAGSIGVYYGDDRDTVYLRPNEDVEDVISIIERAFEQLPFSGGKSPNGTA